MSKAPAEAPPPIVRSLGLCQLPSKSWCVVYLETAGHTVTKREVVEGPVGKGLAAERLKLEVVRRLLLPGAGVK